MVGGTDHQDTVVAFEAVDFIQEVGAHAVGDDAVEVFEDEVAGGVLARFVEDRGDGVFGSAVGGEGADIERGDWGREAGEGVHGSFDRDGFAVACGGWEAVSHVKRDSDVHLAGFEVEGGKGRREQTKSNQWKVDDGSRAYQEVHNKLFLFSTVPSTLRISLSSQRIYEPPP